jgi:hypothetical protein
MQTDLRTRTSDDRVRQTYQPVAVLATPIGAEMKRMNTKALFITHVA